jgi:hypothetical protein
MKIQPLKAHIFIYIKDSAIAKYEDEREGEIKKSQRTVSDVQIKYLT